MLTTKEFTDKYCGGDEAKHRALRREIRKDSLSWNDVVMQATFLPALEDDVQQEIIKYMGYLPDPAVYVPHEPFVKALLQEYQKGIIGTDEYETALNRHIRHIIKDDMEKGGWADNLSYTVAEFKAYMNYLPQFSKVSQDRITMLLGFVPCLESSLKAELLMREQIATTDASELQAITFADAKVITIVHYRLELIAITSI